MCVGGIEHSVWWYSPVPPHLLTKVSLTRYVDASPDWAKQLEADLPAGKTTVTFVARSPVSDESATCSFIVEVRGGWPGLAYRSCATAWNEFYAQMLLIDISLSFRPCNFCN